MASQTKDEVKQLKEQIQAREAQIDKLMECMNKVLPAKGGKAPMEPKKIRPGSKPYDNDGNYVGPISKGCYCWSHGFDPRCENHNSKTCLEFHRKPGHKEDAAQTDRKGGSTRNAPPEFEL